MNQFRCSWAALSNPFTTIAKQKPKTGKKSCPARKKYPKQKRGKLKELLKCIKVNGFWLLLSDNKKVLSSIDVIKHWQGQARDKPLTVELARDPTPLLPKQAAKERANKLDVAKKRRKTSSLSSKSSAVRWNGKKKNLKQWEKNSTCWKESTRTCESQIKRKYPKGNCWKPTNVNTPCLRNWSSIQGKFKISHILNTTETRNRRRVPTWGISWLSSKEKIEKEQLPRNMQWDGWRKYVHQEAEEQDLNSITINFHEGNWNKIKW